MVAPDPLELVRLLATLMVGIVGAWIAGRLHVPAGALIGPMVTVGALNLLGVPLAHLGSEYRLAAQFLVGATVAATLTPAIAMQLMRLIGPVAVCMATLIVLGLLGGWVVHLVTGLQLASSLFAGAPGGVVEMSLAAGDVGGDAELVATIQFARLLAVATLVPALMRWGFGRRARERESERARDMNPSPENGRGTGASAPG
jgi:membrane AbrB-like protein